VTRVLASTALILLATLSAHAEGQAACAPTRADMLGPFYEPNAPERSVTGRGLTITGRVATANGCGPLAGALLEWWSANPHGDYDVEHRAAQRADGAGRYRYETDFPGGYGGRPFHVHVRVTALGHRPLVTQLYPRPGQTAIETDFVLVPD
jgi:protocatechuate 3,4-dioxygenase beta subunit